VTELYPLLSEKGELRGVVGTGGDATKLCTLDGKCSFFLWMTPFEAWNVSSLMGRRGVVQVEGPRGRGFAPLASWVLAPPYVHARSIRSIDEYASYLARLVGRDLRGKRVLLGFSGGKDSVAALLVLLALRELINFKLHVLYVHIPFLEPEHNVDFVQHVSARLGVDIDIVEAPRREMKTLLKWKGMPRRGYRFCTVYKAKPMRRLRKEDPNLVEVIGDRLTESPKRFMRLSKAAAARTVLVGRKFRPTYLFTLLDVVSIVREAGLVHPDYLKGLPRVACTLCPYRALYEFGVDPDADMLEASSLTALVYEKMWRKWYGWTSFEVFRQQRLWRFSALVAKPLLYLKQLLAGEGYAASAVSARSVAEAYRRLWIGQLPGAPLLRNPWLAGEVAIRASRQRLPVALPREDEVEP